jgi:copper chaperone CopZ
VKKSFLVKNIKCEGCANSIKKALSSDFDFIEIDLTTMPRMVTVDINSVEDERKLKEILIRLGYPLIDDRLSKSAEIKARAKSFVSCAVGKFTLEKGE